MSEHSRACGIHVMDNRSRGSIIDRMNGLGAVIPRCVTLLLVLAVFAGSLGLGTMSHAAPQTGDAHAQHMLHDMAGMAQDPQCGTGGTQTTDADCAMAVCCFSDVEEPHADFAGVAMTARFAGLPANPAMQPAPDRADKPPRRT